MKPRAPERSNGVIHCEWILMLVNIYEWSVIDIHEIRPQIYLMMLSTKSSKKTFQCAYGRLIVFRIRWLSVEYSRGHLLDQPWLWFATTTLIMLDQIGYQTIHLVRHAYLSYGGIHSFYVTRPKNENISWKFASIIRHDHLYSTNNNWKRYF